LDADGLVALAIKGGKGLKDSMWSDENIKATEARIAREEVEKKATLSASTPVTINVNRVFIKAMTPPKTSSGATSLGASRFSNCQYHFLMLWRIC